MTAAAFNAVAKIGFSQTRKQTNHHRNYRERIKQTHHNKHLHAQHIG